ncbi:hypothetical protein KDA00_02940 [Candidatus Saccharibacteria bacterium]|nr:hypothetical protein [Candidatus Saccharibacteria bacterium]
MNTSVFSKHIKTIILLLAVSLLTCVIFGTISVNAATSQSGSIGVEGTISSPPPTQGATISVPTNGQTFTTIPVTVSGICPTGLLVKVFKNNVFAGAVQCTNGSYSIVIDLFPGTNDLVARVYDALDQPGPDSNIVTVNFVDNRKGASSRVTLTSNYAKRGANPGEELIWPIILSGGIGPYAISVDWGDGSAPDLISQEYPGTFNISHKYDSPGVYNIVVKATDKDGVTAYLQLVGVGNGPLSQDTGAGGTGNGGSGSGDSSSGGEVRTKILWQPAALTIPFVLSTFWLGKKYELHVLRKKIERGDRPF